MKFLKRVWMGAGYLEGYGEHPGTLIVFAMLLACGLAGVQKGGLAGFIGGAVFGAICVLPFYIIGCVDRAKSYEADMEATMNRLKRDYSNGN